MLYIKIEDNRPVGYPLREDTVRQILSNISLPVTIDLTELLILGYAQYQPVLPPEVGVFQVAVEREPEFDGSVVTQTYEVRNMSEQEIAAATQKKLEESKMKQRHLLTLSDWTELPSVRAKNTEEWAAAWDTYRTELRDLDKLETWPFVTNWPSEPLDRLDVPEESE